MSRPKFESPVIFPPGRARLHQFHADRIGNEHENDRNPRRFVLQVERRDRASHQRVGIHRDQLGGHAGEKLRFLIRKAVDQRDGAPTDVT
jgi:hypothetical protein